MISNKEVAKIFSRLADLMEYHDENPFKIKSYSGAYLALRRIEQPVAEMSEAELTAVKGIGASIAKSIHEIVRTNTLKSLEDLLAKTPAGVVDMLGISGFGVKKIKQLVEGLGVENLGELLYACEENRLVGLKGFGAKSQTDLQQKIQYLLQAKGKFLYANILPKAKTFLHFLSHKLPEHPSTFTGDLRRFAPIINSIDFLTTASFDDIQAIWQEDIGTLSQVKDKVFLVETVDGIPFFIHSCSPANWGSKLFSSTGTRVFLKAFLAQTHQTDFTNILTEEALFEAANIPYIVPELRENESFINTVMPPLNELSDIKGINHAHSTYSDGMHTLRQMAEYTKAQGFAYLGITDHSKAAFYANGLKEDALRAQWAEIDLLNAELAPFRIFKGIEADILNDGSLDYDEEIHREFDFIIASVHSNLKMDIEKATQRLIRAIQHPYTRILGHPTGRLLLSREGYPIDHKAVIDACAANKVVIELNANPNRLDIDYNWIAYCIQKGVKISINPDAHSTQGIHDIQFGVLAARKGGLCPTNCLTAHSLSEFEEWINEKKL